MGSIDLDQILRKEKPYIFNFQLCESIRKGILQSKKQQLKSYKSNIVLPLISDNTSHNKREGMRYQR